LENLQNSLRDTAWRNVAVAQITDTSDFMLGNATERISQPALGIDFVELRRLDKSNRESVNE
jgi:hypothetical protein